MSGTIDDADDDAEDAPDAALIEAYTDYAGAGLRLPPVPHALVPKLEAEDDFLYFTAPCDIDDRDAFFARARDPDAAPHVAFGHTGHGQASWYLCYQLIDGPLRVFLRQSYGSPYQNEEDGRDFYNLAIERIEELVVYADRARGTGRLGDAESLLLVVDDAEPSGWEVIGGEGWRESEDPLGDAFKRLT